jgi:peptide/nickel transport system permease protein
MASWTRAYAWRERPERVEAWGRVLHHPTALLGIAILLGWTLAAAGAPLLSPHDPTHQDLEQVLRPPSVEHPLGTDHLGRDILARILHGARLSLFIGVLAVALGGAVGIPLGVLSGYYGGLVDLLVQRAVDVLLAFPTFLLALTLVALLGVGLGNVIVAVGVSAVPRFARLVRSSVLSIREQTYVEAARALGLPDWAVLLRHVLPNALTPVIVQASLGVGLAILVAAGLGFLGLGVQPPTPEWGAMLGEGRQYIFHSPYAATFPGLAIFLTVMAFNLLGDGLRDLLDPRLRGTL